MIDYDGVSKKILGMFREKLVVRKSELVALIAEDVGKNPGNPRTVVEAVTKGLIQKGLITPLYASESTFAITQRGMK